MNKIKLVMVLVALCALSSTALANGSVAHTQVSEINVAEGWGTVDVTDNISNKACTSNTRFAFPVDTDTGKAYLKVLLSAQLSGKKITIWGTGTCQGTGERILQVRLES